MFTLVILAVAATAVAAAPSPPSTLLASSHIAAPLTTGFGLGLGSSLLTTPYASSYAAPIATSTFGLSPLGTDLGIHSGLTTSSLGLDYGLRSAPLLTGTTFGSSLGLGLPSTSFPTPLYSSLGLRSGFGLGLGTYGLSTYGAGF